MRWVENKAFPYPVLSSTESPPNRDYVGKEFQAAYDFKVGGNGDALLDIDCKLSEKSIRRLIDKNKAAYAVEIYCPKTFLRRLLKSKQSQFTHTFEQGELHERVELSSYVVCLRNVRKHRSKSFHSEFGKNVDFNLSCGDVLAVGLPVVYWWDLEFRAPISTVFELEENSHAPVNSFLLTWDNEKVKILMRRETKERFNQMRRNRRMKPFLLMSVYLAAVTEALRMMADSNEYQEKKWFRAISYKLDEKNIPLDKASDFSKIAQQLLDWPLGKMLKASEDL